MSVIVIVMMPGRRGDSLFVPAITAPLLSAQDRFDRKKTSLISLGT
jgi:hypothetical protein